MASYDGPERRQPPTDLRRHIVSQSLHIVLANGLYELIGALRACSRAIWHHKRPKGLQVFEVQFAVPDEWRREHEQKTAQDLRACVRAWVASNAWVHDRRWTRWQPLSFVLPHEKPFYTEVSNPNAPFASLHGKLVYNPVQCCVVMSITWAVGDLTARRRARKRRARYNRGRRHVRPRHR